jgi:hypothetical protein
MEDSANWDEWDVCRSLFDNHVSPSFEANLEHMFKSFGFYLPDAQFLKDPEGLLRWAGGRRGRACAGGVWVRVCGQAGGRAEGCSAVSGGGAAGCCCCLGGVWWRWSAKPPS